MARVLISGASGLIGRALVSSFEPQNTQIVRLVRGRAEDGSQISWDPLAPLSANTVSGFEAVIHLAGESVVGRWTAEKKRSIRESRIVGTKNLTTALARSDAKPKVLICASAVGFYGDRGDELLTEESAAGTGFAADLARDWEAASEAAAGAGIRTLNLRIGLLLSGEGGALEKMLPPFRMGLGGRLGSGTQWWSWIHVDDMVRGIHHIIHTESLSGPVNMVGPGPVRNAEFARVLAAAVGRRALFPVPAFAARLAFGEMAQELMLSSQRAEPAKLLSSGYTFRFRELRPTLENVVG